MRGENDNAMQPTLPQLIASEKILTSANKNQHIKFRNREHCLQSIFWTIFQNLEVGKHTVLVANEKEDKEYITYLLSKYNLHTLSLVVQNNEKVDSLLEQKIIEDATSKVNESKACKAEYITKVQSLADEMSKKALLMRAPTLGQLNLLDMSAHVSEMKRLPNANLGTVVRPPFSTSDLSYKKALLDKAQKLYHSRFRFYNNENPINETTLAEVSVASIVDMLDSLLSEATKLQEKFDDIEFTVTQSVEQTISNDFTSVKDQISYLTTMARGELPLTDTEIKKQLFHQAELYAELEIETPPPAKAEDIEMGLMRIEDVFQDRQTQHNQSIQSRTAEILMRMTPSQTNAPEVGQLILSVNALMAKVAEYDIFKNNINQKSSSLKLQKDNLCALKKQLNHAIYFMTENIEYIEWLEFEKGISDDDKALIKHMQSQGGFWADAFQDLYIREIVDQQKAYIGSINELNQPLNDAIEQCSKNRHRSILQEWQTKRSAITPIVTDWKTFLDDNAASLMGQYPLIIVDEAFYEQYGQRLVHANDAFIFLDNLPEAIYQGDNENIICAYSPMHTETISLPAVDVKRNSGCSYIITRKLSMMSADEKNYTASYLGKSMKALTEDFSIFQTKDISIVSFWSPKNNTALLEALSHRGIKEIMTDNPSMNLIPATLTDADRKIYILVEDDLLTASNLDSLIRQHLLLEDINDAGLEILSLDNYKKMTKGNQQFNKFIEQLSKAQMDKTPALV